MRGLRGRRIFWSSIASLAVLLGVAILARNALAGAVLPIAGRAFGYDIHAERISLGWRRVHVIRLDVRSRSGEPVLSAERVDATLDLAHAFSARRTFDGLTSLDLERPELTIIRHRDGSYNVPIAGGGKGGASAAGPSRPLPHVALRIAGGSALVLDPFGLYPQSRRIALDGLNFDARLDPKRRSQYAIAFRLVVAGRAYPVRGAGTIDPAAGFERQRFTAAELPLGPLVNYALDSPKVNLASARLIGVDACLCGIAGQDGAIDAHVTGSAFLRDFKLYLGGLRKPIRDGTGRVYLYDQGVTAPLLSAAVAGIPLRITGALYGLSAPTFRLGVTGAGDLDNVVAIVNQSRYPLSGRVRFGLLIEGAAANPLVLASFNSRRIGYGRYPIEAPSGTVALQGTDAAILRASAGYGPLAAGASGSLTLGKHTDFELLTSLATRSDRLPYVSLALPPMPLHATAVLAGRDAAADGSGILQGASAAASLSTLFRVDRTGTGTVGPLLLEGPGGASVYAEASLDRPHRTYEATASLRHVAVRSSQMPQLPGLRLPPLPSVAGTVDGELLATTAGRQSAVAGNLTLSGIRVRGAAAGTLELRGAGTADGRGVLAGRYRGSLEQLAALAPGRFAARGRVDVPFRVALSPRRVIAQVDRARLDGVELAGIAVQSVSGTFGMRRGATQALDVYAAQGQMAGGTVTASGGFGNGGTLRIALAGLQLDALGRSLPLSGGRLDGVATVSGSMSAPKVAAGVVLRDGHYRQFNIAASTLLAFANGRLAIDDGLVQAGPAVASLNGSVADLRGGNPRDARYSLDARLRDADVATLASVARTRLPYPEGTLDGELHVAGRGSAADVAGQVALPEGSLNGLAFRDASVSIAGTPAHLQARGGRVTVGTSRITFAGGFGARYGNIALAAPSLDLANFNDYFDAGDTLGGKGSASATLAFSPASISTSGKIALAGARYRRFALGNARATWGTAGRTIRGTARIAGAAGTVNANAAATLAAIAPSHDALHRTTIALEASARRIDLSTWLPAAGLHAPIEGYVDATASARGAYPNLDLAANGALSQGLVNRVPIRKLTVALSAARGRATLSNATLEIPQLSASADGTFGLEPRDPFALNLRANSPNIGALADVVTGKKAQVTGALDATARITGTLKQPQGAATVALQKVTYHGYTLPSARADVAYAGAKLSVRDATVALQRGQLTARGAIPVQTPPAQPMLPANAPVELALNAQGVDLAQFAALLPKGTQLAGTLDGNVAVGGTTTAPELNGALALAKLTYSGPQERTPITDGVAQLVFSGTTIALQNAQAKAGGGTIGAQATIRVPNLRDPSLSTVAFKATADNAVLDLPQYFKGRVNGDVTVARALGSKPVVGGAVAFDSTRIPLTAIYNPNGSKSSGPSTLPDVALDLAVTAGSDVRVQSGTIDVGARGNVHVGGSLSSPTLNGRMESTGGSLNFYRNFLLQSGTLAFSPDDGLIPYVHAVATTQVPDPSTYVTLTVTGLATNLNVALGSDPQYSREQILGLLVGAQSFGAVSGVATAGAPQSNLVASVAQGELGNLLTRNLLEPFSAQLGNTIGLQSLGIAYNAGQGGLGLNASKRLLRNVNAVYAQTFNYPQRQSIGLRVTPNPSTAVQLTFFTQPGSGQFLNAPTSLTSTNVAVSSGEPENGTNGYSITIQRRFR